MCALFAQVIAYSEVGFDVAESHLNDWKGPRHIELVFKLHNCWKSVEAIQMIRILSYGSHIVKIKLWLEDCETIQVNLFLWAGESPRINDGCWTF